MCHRWQLTLQRSQPVSAGLHGAPALPPDHSLHPLALLGTSAPHFLHSLDKHVPCTHSGSGAVETGGECCEPGPTLQGALFSQPQIPSSFRILSRCHPMLSCKPLYNSTRLQAISSKRVWVPLALSFLFLTSALFLVVPYSPAVNENFEGQVSASCAAQDGNTRCGCLCSMQGFQGQQEHF